MMHPKFIQAIAHWSGWPLYRGASGPETSGVQHGKSQRSLRVAMYDNGEWKCSNRTFNLSWLSVVSFKSCVNGTSPTVSSVTGAMDWDMKCFDRWNAFRIRAKRLWYTSYSTSGRFSNILYMLWAHDIGLMVVGLLLCTVNVVGPFLDANCMSINNRRGDDCQ